MYREYINIIQQTILKIYLSSVYGQEEYEDLSTVLKEHAKDVEDLIKCLNSNFLQGRLV